MKDHIKKSDYAILIYAKENKAGYRIAMDALSAIKLTGGWDRIEGVTIGEDCRIPQLYHGDDLAIIMERYDGSGKYQLKIMGGNK